MVFACQLLIYSRHLNSRHTPDDSEGGQTIKEQYTLCSSCIALVMCIHKPNKSMDPYTNQVAIVFVRASTAGQLKPSKPTCPLEYCSDRDGTGIPFCRPNHHPARSNMWDPVHPLGMRSGRTCPPRTHSPRMSPERSRLRDEHKGVRSGLSGKQLAFGKLMFHGSKCWSSESPSAVWWLMFLLCVYVFF